MQRTAIDWVNYAAGWRLTHTWNPVVGCKRRCPYCYARQLNTLRRFIPVWHQPVFYPNRLLDPHRRKKAAVIFVGSMSDICFWEPHWVRQVISACGLYNRHTYLFLTKDASVYKKYAFPDNCWLGATVTDNTYLKNIIDIAKLPINNTFISFEPLLSSIMMEVPRQVNWVIVGAMTGHGKKYNPLFSWVRTIQHHNIYYKKNLLKVISNREIDNARRMLQI